MTLGSFLATLYLAFGITNGACTDTPGWRNNWVNCRNEGFSSWQGCEPGGWTCDGYLKQGMCTGSGPGAGMQWTIGAAFNYPERNCCVCGKPDDETPNPGTNTCAVSSWGAWGACSADCDGGTQSRVGTGTSTETPVCVDTPGWFNNNFMCRSEGFQGWQGCEPQGWTCYGYVHERMCIGNGPGPGMEITLGWVFNYPELNCCACGKQATASSCSFTETRACNEQPCSSDCVGSWSTCGADCQQTFEVTVAATGAGSCEAADGDVRDCAPGVDDCPVVTPAPTAVDCVLSSFGEWSDCSVTCEWGVRSRSRVILVEPTYDGAICEHLNEEEVCDAGPCVDPDSCEAKNGDKNGCKDAGCLWDKNTKLCSDKPAPTGCGANDAPDTCAAVRGCRWKNGKCKGTPVDPNAVRCADYHRDREGCLAHAECKFKKNKCKNN